MQITRLGHAAVLVELGDARILIDPGSFTVDEAFRLSRLSAVIITHGHHDHVSSERLEELLALNPKAPVFAGASTAAVLGPLATTRLRVMFAGELVRIGEAELVPVGGLHAVIHKDFPREENLGVTLSGRGHPRFFHPGDSYEYVPPGIDILAVPISSPWSKLSETVDFVRAVQPGSIFPVHDALFSAEGKRLFWSWIPMLAGEHIQSLNPAIGSPTEFAVSGEAVRRPADGAAPLPTLTLGRLNLEVNGDT